MLTSHPDSLFSNELVKVDNQLIQLRVRKPEPTISDVFEYLIENYGNNLKHYV